MKGAQNIYIAVIDNEASVCRSMGRLLRAAGLQSISYASAEDYLADTKHPKFDCLVLDIQLPGISGIELQKRLAAVNDTTPIVFVTAHDSPELRTEAQTNGCAGYFHKTDAGTDVLGAIRRSIGRERIV